MADPPSEAGAVKLTVAWASLALAVPMVGGPGTVWMSVMEYGASNPVLAPEMVVMGVALPLAPGAYSVIELFSSLVTTRSPEPSRAMPAGWASPVLAPEMVVVGVASPLAPGAYSVIAVVLVTNRSPGASKTMPTGA